MASAAAPDMTIDIELAEHAPKKTEPVDYTNANDGASLTLPGGDAVAAASPDDAQGMIRTCPSDDYVMAPPQTTTILTAAASCDICIMEFQVGSHVAWSKNSHCRHAFHVDCILDWLCEQPTCPTCRQDYIMQGL